MSLRPYEVVFIVDPDLTQEETEAMVEKFRALAEAQGVQELRVDTTTLGRRKLAYVINHKRDGLYVVMQFMAEPAAPAEIERVLRITDGILRTMVVRLDEMPPEPAAAPPAVAEEEEAGEAEEASLGEPEVLGPSDDESDDDEADGDVGDEDVPDAEAV
jgi:small subunit ribosomal protein S6